MSWRVCTGWLVSGLVCGVSAQAAFTYQQAPFLSVDLNGEGGPTQANVASANWVGWAPPGGAWSPISQNFAVDTAYAPTGTLNVTITAFGAGTNQRNRGLSSTEPLGNMLTDFIYATRDTSLGLGGHGLVFDFTGLIPDAAYELTFFSFDSSNSGDQSFMAYGIEDPRGWDTYQPEEDSPAAILARVQATGPWPSNQPDDDYDSRAYAYAGSFTAMADATGALRIYGWNDSNSYSGTQLVSMTNGFQVGLVPEPASLVLAGVGLGGLLFGRRGRI